MKKIANKHFLNSEKGKNCDFYDDGIFSLSMPKFLLKIICKMLNIFISFSQRMCEFNLGTYLEHTDCHTYGCTALLIYRIVVDVMCSYCCICTYR